MLPEILIFWHVNNTLYNFLYQQGLKTPLLDCDQFEKCGHHGLGPQEP
jgi:hypothetical protein